MEFLKSALYFIAVLSVLIIVHEWGHYIVAKMCKMRVEDFSLFFGKRLIRLGRRHGTEYNIRMIPLGGFVKIAGMEPDDMGTPVLSRRSASRSGSKHPPVMVGLTTDALENVDLDQVSDNILTAVQQAVGENSKLTEIGKADLEALLLSPKLNAHEHHYVQVILEADTYKPDPAGYNQKPLWQRAAVIFAGPFMSVLFGYLLFCVMGFTVGLPDPESPYVNKVNPGSPAQHAGLRSGDRILQINGQKITDTEKMVQAINAHPSQRITLLISRNDQTFTVSAVPNSVEVQEKEKDGKIVKKTIGRLGFEPGVLWKHYSAVGAIQQGTQIVYEEITGTIQALFSRHIGDNIGGPITIGQVISENSKQGPNPVAYTAALLSVSVGLLNLFPIPILDGGQLMLLGVELLRRRKLSSREVYAAQMVGISIIGVIFVLVMYNDILRVFLHRS